MINAHRGNAINLDKANLQSLPLRAYLDQTVIPTLIEGLKLVARERFAISMSLICTTLVYVSFSNDTLMDLDHRTRPNI